MNNFKKTLFFKLLGFLKEKITNHYLPFKVLLVIR